MCLAEASKHGFTDAIFEIFCTIPPSFDACSYVRGYLNYPELQNMKLTSEMIKAMQDALQSHLDYETTLAEKDEVRFFISINCEQLILFLVLFYY